VIGTDSTARKAVGTLLIRDPGREAYPKPVDQQLTGKAMSTTLLKFQHPNQPPKEPALDTDIIVVAVDASPEPMAVSENGKLIFANRSFAQLSAQFEEDPPHDTRSPIAGAPESGWQTTPFSASGRTLSLTTLRREPPGHSLTEVAHLEMVGRLVGGVAHDFNNLLTGILLYCDLLKTKVAPKDPLGPRIEEIRHAAEQGAGLIRQLMTVGREETEAPHWVSFNHAVQELVPLLRHLVGEHILITTDLAEGTGPVGIRLAEAQQIILNLVLNARDAMPAGGRVCLETRWREFEGTGPGDRILEFTVSDSGAGMDPQTAAHIFEPFYTTKAPGRGTGTGLATVRRIAEGAGGITCVDTSPGKGTRMTVRLPQVELTKAGADAHGAQLQQDPTQGLPQSETQESENRGAGL
jgi:signal transduction histidine kinase